MEEREKKVVFNGSNDNRLISELIKKTVILAAIAYSTYAANTMEKSQRIRGHVCNLAKALMTLFSDLKKHS